MVMKHEIKKLEGKLPRDIHTASSPFSPPNVSSYAQDDRKDGLMALDQAVDLMGGPYDSDETAVLISDVVVTGAAAAS